LSLTPKSPALQLPKKMDPEEYDFVIVGGGTGSTIAAWTFAKQGQRVAAIDRKRVGEEASGKG
jgi:glycine/D-amino acid oxidase-like deaminating enzyme